MSGILALVGDLVSGLAALAPMILAYLAGGRGAKLKQTTRTLERRNAQVRLGPASDRAVAGRLRDGTF